MNVRKKLQLLEFLEFDFALARPGGAPTAAGVLGRMLHGMGLWAVEQQCISCLWSALAAPGALNSAANLSSQH